MGVIMSAMSPSARPTTERHTIPVTSRILYGLIYRNSRPNSSRCVKDILDPYFAGLHASLEAVSVKVEPPPDESQTRTADFGTLRIARAFVKPSRPSPFVPYLSRSRC